MEKEKVEQILEITRLKNNMERLQYDISFILTRRSNGWPFTSNPFDFYESDVLERVKGFIDSELEVLDKQLDEL